MEKGTPWFEAAEITFIYNPGGNVTPDQGRLYIHARN